MKSFLSKMSLYDFLAMEIPGWLILHEIAYLCNIYVSTPIREMMIIFIGYMVGVACNALLETIFMMSHLRNPTCLLKRAITCKHTIIDEKKLKDEAKINIATLKDDSCALKKKRSKKEKQNEQAKNRQILQTYYRIYDQVIKDEQCAKIISTMERHIAFLRNMIIPMLLFVFIGLKLCDCCICCCVCWTPIIGCVLLICACIAKQYKLFQYIFETYCYHKK